LLDDIFTGFDHFNICQVKPPLPSAPVMFLNSVSASKEVQKNIRWTEIIAKGDPRANSPPMHDETRKKINGLILRGIFKLVILPDTAGADILLSRFIFTGKQEDGREVYKAPLVQEDSEIF
jgi:hypothetical protein